jgi:hypothetical protein
MHRSGVSRRGNAHTRLVFETRGWLFEIVETSAAPSLTFE